MNFFDKLLTAIEQQNSLLYVALDPDPDRHSPTVCRGRSPDGPTRPPKNSGLHRQRWEITAFLTSLRKVVMSTKTFMRTLPSI